MANEEEEEKEKEQYTSSDVNLPKAKFHPILQDLTKQLSGQELSTVAEVGGHEFYMTTISADEEMWADGVMQINTPAQAYSSFRMTRLAAAIKDIDGIPVSELFQYPDDMSSSKKKEFESSKYTKRTWEMGQVYMWIGDLSMPFIDALSEEYQKISKKRKESIGDLKKSSARTSGGMLEDTSSPEKESSQVTKM